MNSGFVAHYVLNYTPAESYRLCSRGALIVDVREKYMTDFKMFDVENLIYIPFSRFTEFYMNLPSDRTLIFADSAGLKSRECVIFMMNHGYENVANMAGGMIDGKEMVCRLKLTKISGFPVHTYVS